MVARTHDQAVSGGQPSHDPGAGVSGSGGTPSPARPASLNSDASHPHSPGLILTSLLAVYLAWGSTYLAIRVALTALPPFLLAGVRAIVAGSILLAWARWRGIGSVSREAVRNAAVVGVLLLAGGNGLVTFAEQFVSSSLTAAIVSSGSIWIVVMLAILGEVPTRGEIVGIVLGFAGVVVLGLEGEVRASPVGAAALMGATLCWSLGSVLTRRLVLPAGPLMVAIELLAGGAVMTAGGLLLGERVVFEQLTTRGVAAWVYLIVVGSLIGFSAFTFLMRNVRPALATSFVYVNPVVAVALGVLVGGEHVSPTGYAGTAVCVLGLAAVTLAARARR